MLSIPTALSAADREALRNTFRNDSGLPLASLQGLLFAVCANAYPVEPSEWLALVFKEARIEPKNKAEAEKLIPLLLALYNEIDETVWSDEPSLLADCLPLEPAVANFADDAPLHLWSLGFAMGFQWLDSSADVSLPEDLAISLDADLLTLTFFACRETAEEELAENNDTTSLEELAAEVVADFPEALKDYRQIGEAIASLSTH